jgi:hypothetical protein
MTNNETEFANQDEEISYNDMWRKLRIDLGNELLKQNGIDSPLRRALQWFLSKMEEMEAKNKCQ